MRSILFKLSDKESMEFEVARTDDAGIKLSPRKFFLRAVQKELEAVLAESVSDEPDQEQANETTIDF